MKGKYPTLIIIIFFTILGINRLSVLKNQSGVSRYLSIASAICLLVASLMLLMSYMKNSRV